MKRSYKGLSMGRMNKCLINIRNIFLPAIILPFFFNIALAQTTKTISVTNPSGGEEFHPGQSITIQWSPNWVGLEYVDIEIWRNGSEYLEIAFQHQLNGSNSYSYTFSPLFSSSSTANYLVKVYEVASGSGGSGPGSGFGDEGEEGGTLERTGVVGTSGNFKILGSITVTNPTSSTSKRDGNNLSVQWNSNYTEPVEIELWRGSTKTHTITSSTSNDGVYNWSIPTNITTSSSYKVKVFDANDSGKKPIDESNSFTLTKNTLSVTGGSNTTVNAGDNHTFSWSHNLNAGYINLHYKDKNGNWVAIATNVSRSATSRTWTTPSGTNYTSSTQVRIKSTAYPHMVAYVNNIALGRSVTISSPSSSTNKQEGQNLSINWSKNYTGGNVEIRLYKGGNFDRLIESSTPNDGSYNWSIPLDLSTASNYQVWIQDTGGSPNRISNNFSIDANQITIADGSNTSVIAGQNHTFGWSHNLFNGYVDLHYEDGAGAWQTIATNVSRSESSHTWTTPSGANYQPSTRVRIKSTVDESAIAYVNNVSLDSFISFSNPSAGSVWEQGKTYQIVWESNISGNVSIKLFENGNLAQTIAPSTPGDGSYSWTVPASISAGTSYHIEVASIDESTSEYSPIFSLVEAGGPSYPVKVVEFNNYNSRGKIKQATDANGQVTEYFYGDNTSGKLTNNGITLNGNYIQDMYMTGVQKVGFTGMDVTVEYLDDGLIGSMTTQSGTRTSYIYDDQNRLMTVKNDGGNTITEYDYIYWEDQITGTNFDPNFPNYIQSSIYVNGQEQRNSFEYMDGLGRTIQTRQQLGVEDIIVATTYDSQGRPSKGYKPYKINNGNVFDTNFDANAAAYYDGSSGPASGGYPFTQTLYEDSPLGRPVKVIPEGGESESGAKVTSYRIDTWNGNNYQVTTNTDESGRATESWSNSWGQTVRMIADPGGIHAETIFEYDVLGRLAKVTAPNGTETTYQYDGRGNVIVKNSDDAGTVQYKYDSAGNLRFYQDANRTAEGELVFNSYDALGRITAEGIANTGFSNLKADSSYGFKSDTTKLKGRWAYDSKPSTSDYPWNKFTSLIDATTVNNTTGQLTATAWRFGGGGIPQNSSLYGIGVTGNETYQAASTLEIATTIVDPGANLNLSSGGTIILKPGFHAKAGSELTATIDPSLATTSGAGASAIAGANPWQVSLHSYDEEGRLADKWIWTGDRREWDTHLSYDYNRQGEIIKRMISVAGQTLWQHYYYNQRGLLEEVYVSTGTDDQVDPATEVAEVAYSYTATGAIANIDYKGSKDAAYGYTIRDWVKSINDTGSPGGNFAADYNYTDNGNVNSAQYHNPQVQSGGGANTHSWAFGYDGLNRLTGADFGDDGLGSFDVAGLDYDKAGNITGLQRYDETNNMIDNLSYSYAGTNRLQSVADAVASTSEPWDAEDASFGYDNNGNLTSQSGKLTGVVYEHRNLPTQFALASGDTVIANYNADGQRILKETDSGAWSFYVMDRKQPLAVIDNTGFSHINLTGNATFGRWEPGGTRRYYISDHLGSTRAVVDDNGQVLETFDYYPFGLLMPKRSSTTGNTIEKFTGKERDEAIGLDYFGFRYYDPALGRWHSVDPKADDFPAFSPYNYTLNNPINLFDPDGQAPLDDFILLANGQVGRVPTGKTDRFFVREGGQDRRLNLSNTSDRQLLSSRLESNGSFLNNVITSETPNQQALGIAGGANVRKGGGESLVTITKYTGFGVSMAGVLLTGGGILAGSSPVILGGSTLSSSGSLLGATESTAEGNFGAAFIKVLTSKLSSGAYQAGAKIVGSELEKLIYNTSIFIMEGIGNTAATVSETDRVDRKKIKDEEDEEQD